MNTEKNILMLLQSEIPPDIRLERHTKSLMKAGYTPIVLANQYDKSKKGTLPYCKIERVKALFNNEKLNKLLNFPLFLNPRYIAYTIKMYFRYKPLVVHANDLPMVPLALMLKWLFKVPVIYDMHENYPAALKAFKKKGLFNKIFKNPYAAELLDKYCLKKADINIVVAEENRDRIVKFGISEKSIELVGNTYDIENPPVNLDNLDTINNYSSINTLIYTGGVSNDRGLDTAVLAIKHILEVKDNVKLLIIGEGPAKKELIKLSNDNNLNDFIDFIDWPGHKNLTPYLRSSKIGIIPQPFGEFINTTIPNKLFEYMYIKLPLLVSDATPLKRIVEETETGLVFKSNNPVSMAEKFIEILNLDLNKFGENGFKAVVEKYNWSKDSERLVKLYKNIVK